MTTLAKYMIARLRQDVGHLPGVEGAIDKEHIFKVRRIGKGHVPERVPWVAVLDSGPARQEEDGGKVIRDDDASERCGDLRESELLTGELVQE
jgi:hypothetical protein